MALRVIYPNRRPKGPGAGQLDAWDLAKLMFEELYAGGGAAGPSAQNVSYYGITSSSTADYTQKFLDMFTDAANRGVIPLFPPGEFHYSGLISNGAVGMIGAGGILTQIICETNNGDNSRFDFLNEQNVRVSGISFSTANGDVTHNTATETAAILRFNGCAYVLVEDNNFTKCYGAAVLMRSCTQSGMVNNFAKNLGKDGFHVTGLSNGVLRSGNVVINGGDDAFPVVGYVSGTGAGQPKNIVDIGNRVYGVRNGRAYVYLGCQHVINMGCTADGVAPTTPDIISPVTGTIAALYLGSDSTAGTYGVEDIKVRGFISRAVGKSPLAGAIQVVGRSGQPCRDIDIEATVSENPLRGLYASGGVSGGIENLRFKGIIDDTTDVNGIAGSAGAGTSNWAEFVNVRNIELELTGFNAGGAGVYFANTCTGFLKALIRPSETSVNSTQSIVQFQTTSAFERVDLDLLIEAQTANPNRLIDSAPNGATRIRFKQNVPITAAAAKINGAPALTAPTNGGSPSSYTNTAPYPVAVQISGGTVSLIETAMVTGVTTPVYSTRKYKDGSSATSGTFELAPGEGIRWTYSVGPTLTAVALWY